MVRPDGLVRGSYPRRTRPTHRRVERQTDPVNVLGHTYVAAAWPTSDRSFHLGAVLPDLASMARVRLDRGRSAGPLADGIRCHHRVDAVFHDDPVFRQGSAALRRDLLGEGVPTGPARAIGHAGWELLLDGVLVGTPTEEAYRRALGSAVDATSSIVPEDRERWRSFASHRSIPTVVFRYDDPGWVAERLFGMLEHRPRLRLDAALVPAVTSVLAGHVAEIGAAAPDLLARVTVAAEPGGA